MPGNTILTFTGTLFLKIMENGNNKSWTGKNFCLTINPLSIEFYQDIEDYFTSRSGFQYLICAEHDGPSHVHRHMYVQFNKTTYITSRRLFGAHIDPCYGSAQQNIAYVMAEDNKHKTQGVKAIKINEIGSPLYKGGNWSVRAIKEAESPDELPGVLYNTYQKIKNKQKSDDEFFRMLEEIENDSLRPIKVIYFIGRPGHGKTYNAYKYALRHYKKEEITKVTINNNFFEFVGSHEDKCLVVEEFRPSQLHPSSLLQFTDKYGYSCPIKGGHKYVKPECIIICSIIHPSRLYREEKEELNEQFTRRITHLYEVNNDHSYSEIFFNRVHIGGLPVGYRTSFNHLDGYEVTDDWDDTTVVIN